jgi:hypothetical protein
VQINDGSASDFDISGYAHQEVDRFAVLLDVWSNEAAFLQCKKEVMFLKQLFSELTIFGSGPVGFVHL